MLSKFSWLTFIRKKKICILQLILVANLYIFLLFGLTMAWKSNQIVSRGKFSSSYFLFGFFLSKILNLYYKLHMFCVLWCQILIRYVLLGMLQDHGLSSVPCNYKWTSKIGAEVLGSSYITWSLQLLGFQNLVNCWCYAELAGISGLFVSKIFGTVSFCWTP